MAAAGPDKKLCDAQLPNKPAGVTCKNIAGKGTEHKGTGRCSRHGGSTRTHIKSAREHQTREACQRLGVLVIVDPGQALLEELYAAKGAEAFYSALVSKLAKRPVMPKVTEIKGGPLDGEKRLKPGREAVYMPTYHAGGMPTGRAEPHVLVRLWMEERARARVAAAEVLKLGVAQRILDTAESDARRIAEAMIAFAIQTGQDPESVVVREAMALSLRAVARNQGTSGIVDGTATELTTEV